MVKVSDYIVRATELTAISVSRLIKERGFSPQDLLTEEESKAREKLIDQAGVDAMYTALTDIPFVLRVVGSEGRKHIHQYGEALPTLEGTFGTGSLKLDMVNDVVEGRGWSGDSQIAQKYRKAWTIDELVSGKKEDCLVSISAITDDNKWFDLAGVVEKDGGHEVTTLTVSEMGVKIEKRLHR